MAPQAEELSLYIHIPFCLRKCPYCDFNSYAGLASLIPDYLDATVLELRRAIAGNNLAGRPLSTIYLGGGTPSLLSAEQVSRLLGAVRECMSVSADCEITVEANPGTIDAAKLAGYAETGVNRLSLGVQSFDDDVLACLGRIHTAREAAEAVALAEEAGFTNISIDLMWAVPGQTLSEWCRTLREACRLRPTHISAYCLTYEEGTPFYERRIRGELAAASEELELEMLHATIDILKAAGYLHYEISNFARPGFECRHNLAYWTGADYLGVGAGAHSHVRGLRWWNVRGPERYIARISAGASPVEASERLEGRRRAGEMLLVGLRLMDGVRFGDVDRRTGTECRGVFADELRELSERGLVSVTDDCLRLTKTGLELADEVGLYFVDV